MTFVEVDIEVFLADDGSGDDDSVMEGSIESVAGSAAAAAGTTVGDGGGGGGDGDGSKDDASVNAG